MANLYRYYAVRHFISMLCCCNRVYSDLAKKGYERSHPRYHSPLSSFTKRKKTVQVEQVICPKSSPTLSRNIAFQSSLIVCDFYFFGLFLAYKQRNVYFSGRM